MSRKKVFKIIFILMAIVFLFTGCEENNDQNQVQGEETRDQVQKEESREDIADSLSILAYFPLHLGMEYQFAGEGNEYASFVRKIIHVEDNYLQLTDNNGGTIVTSIYELTETELKKIYSQGEFYSEENLIPEAKSSKDSAEVIIRTPLTEGNNWDNNGEKREIVAVNQTLDLPAGTFYGVLQLKIHYKESGALAYEYYAPNLGLIKREYESDGFKVSSDLLSFSLRD